MYFEYRSVSKFEMCLKISTSKLGRPKMSVDNALPVGKRYFWIQVYLILQIEMLDSAKSQLPVERDNPGYSWHRFIARMAQYRTLRQYMILLGSPNGSAKLEVRTEPLLMEHAAIT
jgi:hypothetical protein